MSPTYQDQVFSGPPDAGELQQGDLISFDDPGKAKATEDAEEVSLQSHEGDADFYNMELEPIIRDDDSTPVEELPRVSSDEVTAADDMEEMSEPPFRSRQEKSHSVSGPSPFAQEQASSSRFYRTSSASGLYCKPAYSPIIKSRVAASPVRFDVYARSGDDNDSDEQDVANVEDRPFTSRRTTSSNSGLSATWDDKSPDSESEESDHPSGTPSPAGIIKHPSGSKSEPPLEIVKRKLTALSRLKGSHNGKNGKKCSPDPVPSPEYLPTPPPNTRTPSDSAKKGHGGYPARHSRSGSLSPAPTPRVEWSEPQSSASSGHGSPPLKPALKQGGINKPFGALKSHDRFSPFHRDSLDLARDRLSERWPMMDPNLSCTRDSIVLAKQRFDKYPKSQVVIDEQSGQIKFGGLSPIMDASPPDPRAYWAAKRYEQSVKEREMRWQREIGGHPENDEDCPICEVEKPRSKRKAASEAAL